MDFPGLLRADFPGLARSLTWLVHVNYGRARMEKQATSPLAKKLSQRLDQLGMSRRELARRTGLSRQTVHNIEHCGTVHLKPTTFALLDNALKWPAGTSIALALGQGSPESVADRLMEYQARIAIMLSRMSSDELQLCLIMMEENQLGQVTESTAEFIELVGERIGALLLEIKGMG